MNIINKKHLIYLTILAVSSIVIIPTIYKVITDHQAKLYDVVEKEITEAAEKCWNKKECTTDEITLKILYDLKYLEKQSNPINKKVYDEDSIIKRKNGKIELNLK